MKKVLMGVVLFVVAGSVVVFANGMGEEDVIRARHDEFVAAWNRHDAKALAAMWADDGDLINPAGVHAKGPAEIEKFFEREHATMMKDTTYSGTVSQIRFIGSDVTVVDVDATVTGIKAEDGSEQPPMVHHVTWVAAKRDGIWKAIAARPCVPVMWKKPTDSTLAK
jgi:uncharacterized protein (TIGR02246 family)